MLRLKHLAHPSAGHSAASAVLSVDVAVSAEVLAAHVAEASAAAIASDLN